MIHINSFIWYNYYSYRQIKIIIARRKDNLWIMASYLSFEFCQDFCRAIQVTVVVLRSNYDKNNNLKGIFCLVGVKLNIWIRKKCLTFIALISCFLGHRPYISMFIVLSSLNRLFYFKYSDPTHKHCNWKLVLYYHIFRTILYSVINT